MKRIVLVIAILLALCVEAHAIGQDGFVVNIIKGNTPVVELDKQVVLPFNSEYAVRLKNETGIRCTARVFIDGANVTSLGDIIVDANDSVELERYLIDSLTEGKKFKFVPLDNPAVADPKRAENGIVKVEFRKERGHYIEIAPNVQPEWGTDRIYWNFDVTDTITTGFITDTAYGSTQCSSTSSGATIGGSTSDQRFRKSYIDVEDTPIVVSLKIVGIE